MCLFCFNASYVASDALSPELRACETPSEAKALMEPSLWPGLGARPNTITIVVVRGKGNVTVHIYKKIIADYHGRVLIVIDSRRSMAREFCYCMYSNKIIISKSHKMVKYYLHKTLLVLRQNMPVRKISSLRPTTSSERFLCRRRRRPTRGGGVVGVSEFETKHQTQYYKPRQRQKAFLKCCKVESRPFFQVDVDACV